MQSAVHSITKGTQKSPKPQKQPKPPFLRSLLFRWQVKIWRFLYEHSIDGRHGPIKILSWSIQKDSTEFVSRVEAALLLLGAAYPRGYHRVRRELDYIIDAALLSTGEYNHALRACRIDFARMEWYTGQQTKEWATAYLACVILHEATHGHLLRHGIPYNPTLRIRVERLCVREEERFAARLDPQKYRAPLVPPFDASRWETSWARSQKQTRKELWKRLKHDLREDRKKPDQRLRPAQTSFFAG